MAEMQVEVNGTVWTKKKIQELLSTRDDAVIHGMLKIYEYQTAEEKAIEDTKFHNMVGFSGVDGQIMSSFVGFYKNRNYLSPKQLTIARKKMLKYAGQLLKIMDKTAIRQMRLPL